MIITLRTVIIALIAATVILLFFLISAIRNQKPEAKTARIVLSCLLICMAFPILVISHTLYSVNQTAAADYLTDEQLAELTLTQWRTLQTRTPTESTLPHTDSGEVDVEALKGATLYFYRPLCQDCDQIYDEVMAAVETWPDILFVNTRSPDGKQLVETLKIPSVPAGVYISTFNTETYTLSILTVEAGVETDDDGTQHSVVELDEEAFDAWLDARNMLG